MAHIQALRTVSGHQGVTMGSMATLKDVPEAPAWLIAEMRAAKKPETWIKNRTALDLSDRTQDEIAAIVAECLSVIEQRGQGPAGALVQNWLCHQLSAPQRDGLGIVVRLVEGRR